MSNIFAPLSVLALLVSVLGFFTYVELRLGEKHTKHYERFMESCLTDRKYYECVSLWKNK